MLALWYVAAHSGAAVDRARSIGSLVAAALKIAGVTFSAVQVPDGADPAAQVAAELVRAPERPAAWFAAGVTPSTPDAIGPEVSRRLGIAYVLVDPRPDERADAAAIAAFEACLARADAAVVTGAVPAAVARAFAGRPGLVSLPPLVDAAPFVAARRDRAQTRSALARRLGLAEDVPWLVTDGPMTDGPALESYRTIARGLSRMGLVEWNAVVVGDGPARERVEAALQVVPRDRLRFRRDPAAGERLALLAASDLYLWPALDGVGAERLLDAMAAGLPVVASRAPGVTECVRDGATGRVTLPGNPESFANAVSFLLRNPQFRASYAAAALKAVAEGHDVAAAARVLAGRLGELSRAR